jgi:hypothetical protein
VTTPKVKTIKRQDTRFYVDPDDAAVKVPGVTSVLNMIGKPFLQHWAAKLVAEYAVDNMGPITQLVLNGDRQGAIDLAKGAPRRNTAQAADTGTAAHAAFERMAKGLGPGRVTPDIQVFVEHFDKFLNDQQPEYVFLEETVWSDTYGYAGSFDAYMILNGKRYFVDNKTTRSGIHAEVGIQLAAYRYSDNIIRQDGTRVPTPEADGGLVIHVRPEGLKVVEVQADEECFEVFKALRQVFDYDKGLSKQIVSETELFTTYVDEDALPTGPQRRRPRAPKRATIPA